MASKRKAKSIEEILLSKSFPELQLTPTEAKAIVNIQRTLVDKQMKSDIDDLTTRVLKPRIEILKAIRKAGKDSPLARAEKMIGAKARVPTRREFHAQNIPLPPQPPISPLMLCLTPPYLIGDPNPQFAACPDPNGVTWSLSEFADNQRGIMGIGVRVGIVPGDAGFTACNRDGPSYPVEANIVRAALSHIVNFPAPLTEPGVLWVTVDVTTGPQIWGDLLLKCHLVVCRLVMLWLPFLARFISHCPGRPNRAHVSESSRFWGE